MVQGVSNFRRLHAAARQLGSPVARPKLVAIGCLALLAGLGWAYLGLMLSDAPFAPAPRSGLLAREVPLSAGALYDTLCQPAFGTVDAGATAALVVASMWIAMVAAMMLPTAGPMILTYAEMAATAIGEGDRAASPVPLIAGYGSVWAGYALVAAALQVGVTRAALLDPSMASTSTLFSGAVFLAAGVYQFSGLKHACVTQCQQPAPFFSNNWSARSRDVFCLGVSQGLYCVGCCWAMMLIMFAVGAMNVMWMAVLGVVMAAEKIAATTRFSRAIGIVFTVIGSAFIAVAVAAHWPVRAV
jgi:predicted metal-binding membrane protein